MIEKEQFTTDKVILMLRHHINAWQGKFPSPHFEAIEFAIEALEENMELRKRLQIDPQGGDKIDELEQAIEFLRFEIDCLKSKSSLNEKNIEVIRTCLKTMMAVGNEKSKTDIKEALRVFEEWISTHENHISQTPTENFYDETDDEDYYDDGYTYGCPNCNSEVGKYSKQEEEWLWQVKYCSECGQKLKWS